MDTSVAERPRWWTARKGDLFAKTEKGAKSRLDFADYSDGASWVEFAGELREMRILPKLTTPVGIRKITCQKIEK